MHEQISSTVTSGALTATMSVPLESDSSGSHSASRGTRVVQTLRFGAVILGCVGLGVATCQHALAQHQRLSCHQAGSSSSTILTDLLTPALSGVQTAPDLLNDHQTSLANNLASFAAELPLSESARHSQISTDQSSVNDLMRTFLERRDATLPYRRIYRMSRAASLGQTSIARTGENGLLERTYKVTYRAGKPVAYEYQSRRVVKLPVDMIIDAGYTDRSARALPSRSGLYTRAREIDMVATGYSPMEGSGSGRCANGMRAGYGVVAVDPRLIPLGSKLFVEGYGYALAGDTGGAIRGARIDLGQNTYHAASLIGRKRVRVYILNDTDSR